MPIRTADEMKPKDSEYVVYILLRIISCTKLKFSFMLRVPLEAIKKEIKEYEWPRLVRIHKFITSYHRNRWCHRQSLGRCRLVLAN